jgi:hypothetical protein
LPTEPSWIPVCGSGGWGICHRRFPRGGAAKRIFLNTYTCFLVRLEIDGELIARSYIVVDAVANIVEASKRHDILRKDNWIMVAVVSGERKFVDFL